MNSSDSYSNSIDVEQLPHNAMDYPYFAAVPRQHQSFMALPLTPAHANPPNSDDFNNAPISDPYDFQVFDAYNHFNGSGIAEPPTPVSLSKSSAPPTIDGVDIGMDGIDSQARQGSNSDDEDMTPAQARRKAQNRAAQRAFRERKERHVKELEAQVSSLKQSCDSVAAENERLKLNLQKVAIENEILRATSMAQTNRSSPPQGVPEIGPMHYNPNDFYNEVLDGHTNKSSIHRITSDPDTGGRLLAVGATWDFILQHPLYKKGLVDVAGVSERLKKQAKCDGQGPVFEERVILEAIERCVASGSDELM